MLPELNEKLNIKKTVFLSESDLQSLSLLYLPLLGLEAFSLYLVLNSLHDSIKVRDLLDLTGLTVKKASASLDELEALGLFRTFVKENGSIECEINSPYPPKDFLEDDVLGVFLEGKIGYSASKTLRDRFLDKEEPRKEITKKFYDVFETDGSQEDFLYRKGDFIYRRNLKQLDIMPEYFDLQKFLSDDLKRIIDRRKVTLRLKSILSKIAATYNYNNRQMLDLFLACFDGENIDYSLLIAEAKNRYQTKYKKALPTVVKKEILSDIDIENRTDIKIYSNETFARVMKESGFSSDVMEVLENYVINNLDGSYPSYPYVNKIAKDWLNHNIKTKEEAINYINSFKEKKKKTSKDKSSKAKEEWMDDYYDKLLKGEW